jgi:glyoxylase-like metal-dependent hydrolase (beta-lactamase superfamily II)
MMTIHKASSIQPLTAFPEPGVYDVAPMITLLCATPGAEIHYTLDGSMPTPSSPRFDPYLLIPLEQFGQAVPEGKRTYTIRAIAVLGDQVSDVTVFRYDIEPRDRATFVSQEILPGVRLIRDFGNNKMYLVTGTKRALLIDAGMGTGDLHSYVEPFIGDLPLDVCITHGHPDHIAAMGQFQADCDVYMHHADLPLAQRFQERMHLEIDLNNVKHIDEGFTFDLGDRQLTVYHIPGHSKGCLALLDSNGILISGDAIGSNGPTIVDALWLQMSEDTVDEYLSALQVFRSKVRGKIKYICGGHGALFLEGEAYLDHLQEAAQSLVDQGVDVLVPSPRPAGVWKTVSGDRLTDPNWASINVNRDTCLSAPPDQIASLSNLHVKGATMNEAFKPGQLDYTATVDADAYAVEIVPTTTSRRYAALTINGSAVKSGHAFKVTLNATVNALQGNVVSIKVVAPDGETNKVYSLTVTKGGSQ